MDEIEKIVDDMNNLVGDDALNVEAPAELPSEEEVVLTEE